MDFFLYFSINEIFSYISPFHRFCFFFLSVLRWEKVNWVECICLLIWLGVLSCGGCCNNLLNFPLTIIFYFYVCLCRALLQKHNFINLWKSWIKYVSSSYSLYSKYVLICMYFWNLIWLHDVGLSCGCLVREMMTSWWSWWCSVWLMYFRCLFLVPKRLKVFIYEEGKYVHHFQKISLWEHILLSCAVEVRIAITIQTHKSSLFFST